MSRTDDASGFEPATEIDRSDDPHRPARLETRTDGYERWRAWDPAEKQERHCYVHQLTAIAAGADPREVFSGGRWHIHHCNRIRWDNREANLAVRLSEDHGREHGPQGGR
jgi:hypothetical protein